MEDEMTSDGRTSDESKHAAELEPINDVRSWVRHGDETQYRVH
jgi:hypothetical protein